MRNALLDIVRVIALCLIGAGVYLWVGLAPALVFAGLALLLAVAVGDMRRRVSA